jgi:hypothetical protein
MQAQML